MKKVLLFLLLAQSVLGLPEIITDQKVSAWGLDSSNNVVPLQYVWGSNCGLWKIDTNGFLLPITTNEVEVWDFFWQISTNWYEEVVTNTWTGPGYTNEVVDTNRVLYRMMELR